jgi:hypothetical protein
MSQVKERDAFQRFFPGNMAALLEEIMKKELMVVIGFVACVLPMLLHASLRLKQDVGVAQPRPSECLT